MGHEVVIFGCIEGFDTERSLTLNTETLAALPTKDEWPALVRGMFALPAPWPHGTFRAHVFHFGASFKDEPHDRACWNHWIEKFEALLRRLHWWSATLHITTDFEPETVFRWVPTAAAAEGLWSEPPRLACEWDRSAVTLPADKVVSHRRGRC